jgi:hypothetical protein
VRPICWLHISDIHMRACDAWSHDVVLKAMCEDIERQRTEGTAADFILATGDLAFSGKTEEYALAGGVRCHWRGIGRAEAADILHSRQSRH